jgi:hypothetical protein
MPNDSGLAHIILDFDGTCTQIPPIFERYLDLYFKGLNESGLNVTPSEWRDAQATVREHVAGCPSAPAAGDPYVLADETTRLILRRRRATILNPPVHAQAYEAALAPWRDEARDTFSRLVEHGVNCILSRIPARHSLLGDCATCLATTIQLQPRFPCRVTPENSGSAS